MTTAAWRVGAAVALLVPCLLARGADIVGAAYDAARDDLVVDIAYRGTHAAHAFHVEWGPCSGAEPRQTAGRLLDVHGRDLARESFRTRVRIDLDELPCRPVRATLRLGPVSHATVFIPQSRAQD